MRKIFNGVLTFFTIMSFAWSLTVNILPYRPLIVMSDSMSPTISKGSIILGRKITSDEDIKVGQIYTYKNPKEGYTITHRLIKKAEIGYVFKGDNNEIEDEEVVFSDWIKYQIVL